MVAEVKFHPVDQYVQAIKMPVYTPRDTNSVRSSEWAQLSGLILPRWTRRIENPFWLQKATKKSQSRRPSQSQRQRKLSRTESGVLANDIRNVLYEFARRELYLPSLSNAEISVEIVAASFAVHFEEQRAILRDPANQGVIWDFIKGRFALCPWQAIWLLKPPVKGWIHGIFTSPSIIYNYVSTLFQLLFENLGAVCGRPEYKYREEMKNAYEEENYRSMAFSAFKWLFLGIVPWFLGQTLTQLGNVLGYTRHLVDSIFSFFVGLVAHACGVSDEYPSLTASLMGFFKNLVLLIPAALIIGLNFIPGAGAAALFFESIFKPLVEPILQGAGLFIGQLLGAFFATGFYAACSQAFSGFVNQGINHAERWLAVIASKCGRTRVHHYQVGHAEQGPVVGIEMAPVADHHPPAPAPAPADDNLAKTLAILGNDNPATGQVISDTPVLPFVPPENSPRLLDNVRLPEVEGDGSAAAGPTGPPARQTPIVVLQALGGAEQVLPGSVNADATAVGPVSAVANAVPGAAVAAQAVVITSGPGAAVDDGRGVGLALLAS